MTTYKAAYNDAISVPLGDKQICNSAVSRGSGRHARRAWPPIGPAIPIGQRTDLAKPWTVYRIGHAVTRQSPPS